MIKTFRLIHVRGLMIRLLAALGNRKILEGDKGHNVLFGKRWGEFVINGDSLTYVNWPIVDMLVKEGDGFKGTFFWWGRKSGEFRLEEVIK